jgi:16S rRNA (guanine527-N7)-methyltransferase
VQRGAAVSARLAELAARHGLPPDAPTRLARLLATLAAEPDPHTTVVEPLAAADRHVADSLEALSLPAVRRAAAIADVGAGAGFPGLPLAVALPGASVDLIEAAGRKCAVIERLATAAGAANARALAVRAEAWAGGEGRGRYDVVTVRAVARLAVLVEYAAPLLRDGGSLVAWKGARDRAEEDAGASAAAEVGLELAEVRAVAPFEGARDRHLYVYAKVRETPARVPRRPGMAAKRPLG